ncbi:MAG: hypothetical protein M1826_002910 [Phylliscum demangeonii]|nr:MAG: hypothetical protein M1826_002910 [Phylliscum demangeonii]
MSPGRRRALFSAGGADLGLPLLFRDVSHPAETSVWRGGRTEEDDEVLLAGGEFALLSMSRDGKCHEEDLSDNLTRRVPVVQAFSPSQGTSGTRVTIYLCTVYDPETPPRLTLSVMFGSQYAPSSLTALDPDGQVLRYLLESNAPPFASTGWADPDVPILLRVGDETGSSIGPFDVGTFTYHAPKAESGYELAPGPTATTRKRKSSIDPDPLAIASKRPSYQNLRARSFDEIPTFAYSPIEGAAYPAYLAAEDLGSASPSIADLAAAHAPFPFPPHASARNFSLPFSYASTVSAPSPGHTVSRAPSWSSAYSDASSQPSQSPAMTAPVPMTRAGSQQLAPPPAHSNPPLIRTSTISQAAGPAMAAMASPLAGQAFNPYTMYPHKAVLKIDGDLDAMAKRWTLDEWEAKRRLVQFQRQQNGNTIFASFEAVTASERGAHSICVSCIWWEEKGECFITSVDTIYLLESLVAVRFTVEEKNRIRRNLEGFRPLTVSKGKPDSEAFFKLIMAFPNPKPRNIEKDVKVFPWKIVAHALKKIIGKYSASYASTASALASSISPSSGHVALSPTARTVAAASPEYAASSNASPRAMSESLVSMSYGGGRLSNAALSPSMARGSATLSPLGVGADPRLSLSSMASQAITSSPRAPAFVDQQLQQQQRPPPPQPHPHPAPPRPAWDLGPYLTAGGSRGMSGVMSDPTRTATVDYAHPHPHPHLLQHQRPHRRQQRLPPHHVGLAPADEADVLPSQADRSLSGP